MVCLLCVERSTKYCNYLRLSPTMFFLCTFYGRGSISEHPPHQHEGEFSGSECTSETHNIISTAHPAPLRSTPRHVSKTRKFCATKLLLCSSLLAFDTHMALATFFSEWITRTHMKFVAVRRGLVGCEARGRKAMASERGWN